MFEKEEKEENEENEEISFKRRPKVVKKVVQFAEKNENTFRSTKDCIRVCMYK